ncbi:MAG: efflux transporter outer membrane subunit [Syntrophobacteraceae bacterium]
MKSLSQVVCLCALPLLLSACAVGPDYRRPDVAEITPSDWRWKIAEPKDDAPKGDWWRVFNDPVLDGLENVAVAGNQDLQAAVARVDAARSSARISRSDFFPVLSLDPSVKRERTSGNLPTPIPFDIPSAQVNTFSVPFDLSYEVDLWGRVRRSFEAARAQAQASAADYSNVLLTLTADVAANYFLLRSLDSEIAVLQRTVGLRSETVRILHGRFAGGAIPEIDLAQAKTEVASARADLADATRRRAETLHALALLCGKPASSFEVAERTGNENPPVVPAGLPSSLLERRPDIARAERNLESKSAQIGVARAAYFPILRLAGQAGYLSAEVDSLFSGASSVWSIGPSLSLPVFNAGRTAAGVDKAVASYQEALAQYRQTVLTAFKEVEDSLVQIVLQSEQAEALREAVASAERVVKMARGRYEAGSTNYLEVVDSERRALQYELRLAQLDAKRFAASVRLVKALGGGWEAVRESESKSIE